MRASTAPHAAALAAAVLLFLPSLLAPVAAQAKAKAFCISQFAIASQACSILPPSPPEEHREEEEDDDDDDDDDDHGGDGDRRVRGHAAMLSVGDLMASNNGSGGVPVLGRNSTAHHRGNHTRRGRGRVRRRRRGRARGQLGSGRGRRGRLRDGDGDGGGGGDDQDPDHDDDHDQNPDHGGDQDHDDDDEDPDHDDDHDDDDSDDSDDDDDEEDHDDDHGHEHHHDEELRAYRDCCRWLQEVQKDCVCEALLRLPPFLVKPQHKYVVRVGRTCRIVYRCGGV